MTRNHVKELVRQQLNTVQRLNQITSSSLSRLIYKNTTFKPLKLLFVDGMKFALSSSLSSIIYPFMHRYGDLNWQSQSKVSQIIGVGILNQGQTLQDMIKILRHFSQTLIDMVEDLEWLNWITVTKPSSSPQSEQLFQASIKLNTILMNRSRNLLIGNHSNYNYDRPLPSSFHMVVIKVMNGFRFSIGTVTLYGMGIFNHGLNGLETTNLIYHLGVTVKKIANQWSDQLRQQRLSCEQYLAYSLASLSLQPETTTAIFVINENETINANQVHDHDPDHYDKNDNDDDQSEKIVITTTTTTLSSNSFYEDSTTMITNRIIHEDEVEEMNVELEEE